MHNVRFVLLKDFVYCVLTRSRRKGTDYGHYVLCVRCQGLTV